MSATSAHAVETANTEQDPDAVEVGFIRWLMWTRPIFGGVLVAFGGLVTAVLPFTIVTDILSAGVGGWSGLICGLVELLCGALILLAPSQRKLAAIIAILVGLLSFPLTNLGGLIVGMVCSVFGGCWAFGWTPHKPKLTTAQRKEIKAEAVSEARAEAEAAAAERERTRDYVAEARKKITSWE